MSSHTNLHSPNPDHRISGTPHTKKPPPSSTSQDQQTLKCPRCNSPNTKFCYYNNYSLSQPRHFCKSCRRYWTHGGALRNVPIGGGCRKTKKIIKPNTINSSSPQRFFSSIMKDSSSKFFPPTTTMDLQIMNNQEFLGLSRPMDQAGNLATSIETLSCLNQDLHWRLQQQRIAMLFGNSKEDNNNRGGSDQWNNGIQAWSDLNHYNALP